MFHQNSLLYSRRYVDLFHKLNAVTNPRKFSLKIINVPRIVYSGHPLSSFPDRVEIESTTSVLNLKIRMRLEFSIQCFWILPLMEIVGLEQINGYFDEG